MEAEKKNRELDRMTEIKIFQSEKDKRRKPVEETSIKYPLRWKLIKNCDRVGFKSSSI